LYADALVLVPSTPIEPALQVLQDGLNELIEICDLMDEAVENALQDKKQSE
jgi:hypothetical protein